MGFLDLQQHVTWGRILPAAGALACRAPHSGSQWLCKGSSHLERSQLMGWSVGFGSNRKG